MLVVNRSWLRKRTLSPMPEVLRFSVASLMRCGSMSMPTPRAPYVRAAVIGIRPSPEPRSYTTSLAETFASFSIASTTSCGVGTKMTSGDRSCAGACCADEGATSTPMIARDRTKMRSLMGLLEMLDVGVRWAGLYPGGLCYAHGGDCPEIRREQRRQCAKTAGSG